jgi:hypothetical protein
MPIAPQASTAAGKVDAVFLLTSSPWTSLGLVVCGVWLVWGATKLLRGRLEPQAPRRAFGRINLYALCVMALLMADALLWRPAAAT